MKKLLIALFACTLFMACDKDEDAEVLGNFTVTIENVSEPKLFLNSGVFNTPVGATDPGAIGPGGAYEFTVKAGKGQKLTFATMFVESNDLFFAPDENGIALFDAGGDPINGDVTAQIALWDAGTEVNEEPGVGPNQVMRQSGADTGPDENGDVTEISQVNDGFSYPAVQEVIKVTVESINSTQFKVRIENISTANTLVTSAGNKPVPLSPGVWAVHTEPEALFTAGEADRGLGIEEIAEDGNAGPLGDYVQTNSGLIYPLSPGVWAVHDGGMPIFAAGEPDYEEGLEDIAEDGAPSALGASLMNRSEVKSSGVFNTPVNASAPAPIGPGQMYRFSFDAENGDKLSLATMFVQSNDLFYSFSQNGIDLFNNGLPISGDITTQISLYDAGTEVNEEPGFGPNQVMRQSGPDVGPAEAGNVRQVNDNFSYPQTNQIIKVTITSNQ